MKGCFFHEGWQKDDAFATVILVIASIVRRQRRHLSSPHCSYIVSMCSHLDDFLEKYQLAPVATFLTQ